MTLESVPDLPSQLAVKVMHEIGSNDPDLYGRIQETLNAALAAAPQSALNEGEAHAEDTSVPGDLRPLMGDGSGVVGDRRDLIEQAKALLSINASGNAVLRVPNLAVSIIERLIVALEAPQPAPEEGLTRAQDGAMLGVIAARRAQA